MPRLRAVLLILGGLLVTGAVSAKDERIWVATSGVEAPYQEALAGLRATLVGFDLAVRPWQELAASGEPLTGPVVVLGVEAMKRLAESGRVGARTCLLPALVPRSSLDRAAEAASGRVGGVYFDQPLARLVQFLRQAMPERRRVGVLLGPGSRDLQPELGHSLRKAGFEAVIGWVDDREALPGVLRDVLARSDVLLALPDPMVHNSQTAHHTLLAAYRKGVPVVGYSASFVKAGAAVAVFSTPEQIGRQVGDQVRTAMNSGACPAPEGPAAFEIQVNANVARSLELFIDPDRVERKLRGER